MISLGGLVSQKAFGKFEMGKVISNPFANAFVNEAESSEDHEVSMANNSLDTIIKMATELKAKMGENEKDIPAWIQDHITNAENFISQASSNYHEYGQNEARIAEDSPCWKGYKQVGMKDKGGRQVPNCVPNESVVNENILNEDLDALGLLIPALGAVIGGGLAQLYPYFTGRPNIYSNIKDWWNSKKDNSEMNKIANRIKNDPDVQEFLKKKNKSGWKEMLKKKLTGSELNYINKIYRSRFNSESVNEAPNTGEKIQNLNNRIKVLRDKISATKSPEQKKLHSDRLKNALQSLSNIKKDFGIKKEISNKTPKIFVKTAAVEKKIKELMADRKKAVVPYNTEKDPAKKEKLKQILIKLTQQIQGYEKNLIQLRDMEEEYLQQLHSDAELDTTGL
jgi:flagellar biosynthesis chaperone FliJ